MASAFSWQNSISLFPVLFCTPNPNLLVTPSVFLLFHSSPPDEKDILCVCACACACVCVFWFQKVLQVFIELFNFSFFSICGQGIDLNYYDAESFVLETNQDHSVIFEIPPKDCIMDFFVDGEGYSISSKGSLPSVVDIKFI